MPHYDFTSCTVKLAQVPQGPSPTTIGFLFQGPKPEVLQGFFEVTCPCGVTDRRAVNDFPTEDTPMSCGNPKHWFVQYREK